ncbi:hypothetical protein ILYODFUR_000955 [Ilyodon furcidens]|uniref:Uncharacterized protein n=1 Tax=Ilyodon furcidens TaxID=33524 RepID=A0ABV0VA16_9TELE
MELQEAVNGAEEEEVAVDVQVTDLLNALIAWKVPEDLFTVSSLKVTRHVAESSSEIRGCLPLTIQLIYRALISIYTPELLASQPQTSLRLIGIYSDRPTQHIVKWREMIRGFTTFLQILL